MTSQAHRPVFKKLEGFDPAEMDRRILEGAVAHHSQVGGGTLSGELGAAPLDRTLVNWWTVTADVRVVATSAAAHHSLVLVVEAGERTKINGHAASTGMLVGYGPSVAIDGIMGAGCRLASVAMPPDLLDSAILAPAGITLPAPTDGIVLLRPEPGVTEKLELVFSELRSLAQGSPDLFDDPAWRANVERTALDWLGAAVASATIAPTVSSLSRSNSAEIVRRIDAWLDGRDPRARPQRPSVPDLCRATNVRRRTLERAFADVLGVSPAEHVRMRALNAARRELLEGDRESTVSGVAIGQGFWHLGRFAGQYRTLFGESPSETLRRGQQAAASRAAGPGRHATG